MSSELPMSDSFGCGFPIAIYADRSWERRLNELSGLLEETEEIEDTSGDSGDHVDIVIHRKLLKRRYVHKIQRERQQAEAAHEEPEAVRTHEASPETSSKAVVESSQDQPVSLSCASFSDEQMDQAMSIEQATEQESSSKPTRRCLFRQATAFPAITPLRSSKRRRLFP